MRARPFTVVSLDKLSAGIASAVSELIGEHYSAEITQIDFESELNSWMRDTTVLTLRLKAQNSWWVSDDSALVAANDETEA